MQKHIKFLSGKQREFLLKVQGKSGWNVDELAMVAGVVPRSFRGWKREKLCMTVAAARDFSFRFKVPLPETIHVLQNRWEKHRSQTGKKGGFARLEKYGSPGTQEGRRKGGLMAIRILQKKGIFPPSKSYNLPRLNDKFAEYIGILLGDGGITKGQVTVTLNREKDYQYSKFVVNLSEELFKEKPRIFLPKDEKTIRIYYNGVKLVRLLIKQGLKVGSKVKQQVDVPDWIKQSLRLRVACLKGLMDTDGGIFTHRYKVNGKQYIYKKICFTNRSLPLLFFVNETLAELGFTPKMITKVENKKVWLYNAKEVGSYLKKVGSHNNRLLRCTIL